MTHAWAMDRRNFLGAAAMGAALPLAGCSRDESKLTEADLFAQVAEKMEELQKEMHEAEGEGIAVEYEGVSLKTVELFLGYARWDADHPELLRELIVGWKSGWSFPGASATGRCAASW
jgi:hypothetical protein